MRTRVCMLRMWLLCTLSHKPLRARTTHARTHARETPVISNNAHLDEADDLLDLVELVVELVHDLQRLLPALLVDLDCIGLDWTGSGGRQETRREEKNENHTRSTRGRRCTHHITRRLRRRAAQQVVTHTDFPGTTKRTPAKVPRGSATKPDRIAPHGTDRNQPSPCRGNNAWTPLGFQTHHKRGGHKRLTLVPATSLSRLSRSASFMSVSVDTFPCCTM